MRLKRLLQKIVRDQGGLASYQKDSPKKKNYINRTSRLHGNCCVAAKRSPTAAPVRI